MTSKAAFTAIGKVILDIAGSLDDDADHDATIRQMVVAAYGADAATAHDVMDAKPARSLENTLTFAAEALAKTIKRIDRKFLDSFSDVDIEEARKYGPALIRPAEWSNPKSFDDVMKQLRRDGG